MFSYLTAPTPAQAHLWLTYGWLAACGLAPVVVVLIIWAICMHYTYRTKWRTLDVLLAATLVQEIPNAIVVLLIAAIKSTLIHLPRSVHTRSALGYMLIWATSSTRFYQFAVITSLIVDRALILKWPYRYRFAVRHPQIRIFLFLLALVAAIVGGGAIYAQYLHAQSLPVNHQLSAQLAANSSLNATNQTLLTNSTLSLVESVPYRFTFDPATFERHFNYVFVGIYVFFSITSVLCFLYVECNRPRNGASTKNRYLPSIATLFTTATASSTSTSSSASSSLSASSPLPSRFSSLANLTAVPPTVTTGHANQKSATGQAPVPSFYYGKRDSKATAAEQQQQQQPQQQSTGGAGRGADTLSSLYPISIVDMMMSHENGAIGSSAYASMSTTDNSIYRLIDANNSRSNSLNLVNEGGKHGEHLSASGQHRATGTAYPGQTDPASSLDPLNPSSRVNSFSKSHHYPASSKLKDATMASNSFSAIHRSAFDLRWSSVLGPVTFCLAFNHGPYLIFTLLAIFIPGIWTPFHDLILASLTLFEALLLPFIFFLSDATFRNSVKKSCHCQADKISSKSQHASLAFSERKFAAPPYLHSPPTKSNALGLSTYQSELDLTKQVDPPSSKLKSHFLSRHDLSKPSHATSMLDLSCRTPYHQQSGSRSRHSLALLQHLPANSPTPRSSFRRRPPSVASCHYLYSGSSQNQQQQSKQHGRYPQYLFGVVPSKSESTLSVPLTANYYTPPSMVAASHHLKEIRENEVADSEPKMISTISALGSSHHLNQVPSITDLSRPVLSRQISEPTNGNEPQQQKQPLSSSHGSPINDKSGPRLKELITGLAARSSFKRRSVRKCGSDASTFYTRRNLKRSQIAQNQLSSILYNNFYTKKMVAGFGSQITLLTDSEPKDGAPFSGLSPLPSHLQARHLSYDFSQQSPMANSHVYLPNTSHLDVANRSSSCNQLNGDYHNHLLVKQNLALMASEGFNGYSPRVKASPLSAANDYSQTHADDEHIYASLPEEEEEEEEDETTKQSGSFSARSTLPDNCQLISYKEGQNRSVQKEFDLQVLALGQTKSSGGGHGGHLHGQRQHSSSSTGSDQSASPQSNSSSSTVEDDTSEDIYEEVGHLIGGAALNGDSRRRSASQDTLTGDTEQMGENGEQPMSDDDEDDEDGMDDDRISMLSEASSSTFSSFTTCANQDFEFIVSQNDPTGETLKRSAKGKGTATSANSKTEPSAKAVSAQPSELEEAEEIAEPDTLSMAAIYYNRFILNESDKSKAGHRQRPKVNRRQSFSTAYELRQRILVSQLNRERFEDGDTGGGGGGMELIEEESEQQQSLAQMAGEMSTAFDGHFDDLLSYGYKLNRRISTSEDNLLSIISTIVNCGDEEGQLENAPAKSTVPSSPRKSAEAVVTSSQATGVTSKSPASCESPKKPNGTFLKKDQQPQPTPRLYNKKVQARSSRQQQPAAVSSAIPRATSQPGSGSTPTHNISIKELKSKKQAANKRPTDGTASGNLRPKSALNAVNADRICELGSLWNRSQTTGPSANNPKPVVNGLGASAAKAPRYTATGKLLAATGSVTTSSSSSSSPSTPCRLPTFIPAPVPTARTPRKDVASPSTTTTFNFAGSKLTPPSQYAVKVNKQNARQNAILAKNALSGEGDR